MKLCSTPCTRPFLMTIYRCIKFLRRFNLIADYGLRIGGVDENSNSSVIMRKFVVILCLGFWFLSKRCSERQSNLPPSRKGKRKGFN
ncbi:MAG: hypothetical protein EA411_04260 [Saprospirales bacterium]|nr:MAG: hypothetical protein EA411_04260 [Saprospirales bacterium]